VRLRSSRVTAPVVSATVFVATALVTTALVRESGEQIVDTDRYRRYGEAMRAGLLPYRDFDVEYPPGALLLFLLPTPAGESEPAYFWAFAWVMAVAGGIGVLLTAATLRLLGRARRTTRRILVLLAVSPVVFGGVLLTRFDLVPAVLVAAGTLAVVSGRPRWAALALGAGAAVKWYPLALLPLLAAWTWRRRGARDSVIACALALAVVALAYVPFALLAPADVTASVWRQLSRPLQIESLGAGMLVLLDKASEAGISVERSHGSHNLGGDAAVAAATAASLVSVLAVVVVLVAFGRGRPTDERVTRHVAAVLLALVAFGKVLSPQFLVWLLFPLALVGGRRGAAAGACFAVAAVATAIWFPWLYFELPRERDSFVASLVVLRGAALVAAFAILSSPVAATEPPPSAPSTRPPGSKKKWSAP
jgi:Glycosyltransferase family 87